MNDVDVLYLKKNNRSTDIVYTNSNKTINKTIDKLLDELCVKYLSTLAGRINAVSMYYDIHKYIPIYVCDNLILIQVYPKKYFTQIYINACNVKSIKQIDSQTKVIFINNQTIIVDAPYLRIKQYLEKCNVIKNDQLSKKQERIYKTWQRKI